MAVTINLDTQSTADALVAEYQRLTGLLALIPLVDVSDQGRSVSASASRKSITDALQAIRVQLALMAGPVFSVSRMRP